MNPPDNARDIRYLSLIPRSGRSPGGGNGNALQYSCLGHPMDRGSLAGTMTEESMTLQRVRHNWACVHLRTFRAFQSQNTQWCLLCGYLLLTTMTIKNFNLELLNMQKPLPLPRCPTWWAPRLRLLEGACGGNEGPLECHLASCGSGLEDWLASCMGMPHALNAPHLNMRGSQSQLTVLIGD